MHPDKSLHVSESYGFVCTALFDKRSRICMSNEAEGDALSDRRTLDARFINCTPTKRPVGSGSEPTERSQWPEQMQPWIGA